MMKIKAEAILLINTDDNKQIPVKIDITNPRYRILLKDIQQTLRVMERQQKKQAAAA